MPHSIFGGDELSPGLYGDHEILTFMAQEASKGPPKEVFWRMQEENEPFYHAMSEYAGTAIGDDPLARYEDEDEQDSGEDEADIYDYESFFIPEEGAALEKSFDAMEDGDVKQGLSDIGDIVSSAWDWASDLGSSLWDLGSDIFGGLGEAISPMSAERLGRPIGPLPEDLPDWAGMGLAEDIFRDIGPFTPTYPVATPMPVGDGPSFDDIRRDILIDKLLSEVPGMLDDYAVGAQQIGSNIPFLSIGVPGGVGGGGELEAAERDAQAIAFDIFNEGYPDIDKIREAMDESDIPLSRLQEWLDWSEREGTGDVDFLSRINEEFGIQPTEISLTAEPKPIDGKSTQEIFEEAQSGEVDREDFEPGKKGDQEFEEAIVRQSEIQNLNEVLTGLTPMTTQDYNTARENLRAVFYPMLYRQPGVEQASQYELENLLRQTQLLFFLEQGETAWHDVRRYKSEKTAYEAGIEPFADEPQFRSVYPDDRDDRPTLEKNYEEWLGGYLERPFAQRLNPTEGKDFYTLVKDVSSILNLRYEDPSGLNPEERKRWEENQDRSIWVEGLFGEGRGDSRDELVKMGLTRGGTGRYSQLIHNAAQKQMDYYRNIGWTEERIFDYMTQGMEALEAAPVIATLDRSIQRDLGFVQSEEIRREEEAERLMAEAEEKQEPLGLEYTGKNYMDALAEQDYSWAGTDEFGMPGGQTTTVPASLLSATPAVTPTTQKQIAKTAMLPRTRTVAKKDYQHTPRWYDLIIKDKQGKQIGKHRGKITPWDFQRGGYQKAGWKLSPNQGPLV